MKRDEFLNKINHEIKAGTAKARPEVQKMGGYVYDHIFTSYEPLNTGTSNDYISSDSIQDELSDLEEAKNDK